MNKNFFIEEKILSWIFVYNIVIVIKADFIKQYIFFVFVFSADFGLLTIIRDTVISLWCREFDFNFISVSLFVQSLTACSTVSACRLSKTPSYNNRKKYSNTMLSNYWKPELKSSTLLLSLNVTNLYLYIPIRENQRN